MLNYKKYINLDISDSKKISSNLTEKLSGLISSGKIATNSKLPSQKELAKELKIHWLTVNKSYKNLEKNGYIYQKQGQGSFVLPIENVPIKKERETHSIALITSPSQDLRKRPLDAYYFYEILEGIEEAILNEYSNILMHKFYLGVDEVETKIDYWQNKLLEYDGVLLIGDAHYKIAEFLYKKDKNYVLCASQANDKWLNHVHYSQRDAFYKMTEYLIKKGYSKIAFVGALNEKNSDIISYKFSGYISALIENGIDFSPSYLLKCPYKKSKEQYEAIKQELENRENMEAYICSGTGMAPNLYNIFLDKDLKIPNDLAIVGNDELPDADLFDFFTQLRVPRKEMGKKSLEILAKKIENPDMPSESLMVDAEFIINQSA
jgi:DNA-binding LacI/PurR family transcriptional regulator